MANDKWKMENVVESLTVMTESSQIRPASIELSARTRAANLERMQREVFDLAVIGGGITGASAFASHARILASHFRVVRLQTLNVERALRKQPLPRDYSIRLESQAMAESLDQLGLRTPVYIAGHSMGALVALDFALDNPARVRALVLSEPPAFWVVPPDEADACPEIREKRELTQ